MKNALNWFEIPVKNFDTSKKFYEALFGTELQVMEAMGIKMAFFPSDMENGVGGGIAQGPGYEPAANGTLVYLNGGEDLSVPLSRAEKAGAKIVLPKTAIGPNGFMAHIIDVEGNKIGLHSMK